MKYSEGFIELTINSHIMIFTEQTDHLRVKCKISKILYSELSRQWTVTSLYDAIFLKKLTNSYLHELFALNLIYATSLFLYPLKTSQNLRFSF